MPLFYMHLVDSIDVLLDPDGMEMSADEVPSVALFQARDCMAGDVRNGHLDLAYRIDVHTETGELIHSIDFKDAIKITTSH